MFFLNCNSVYLEGHIAMQYKNILYEYPLKLCALLDVLKQIVKFAIPLGKYFKILDL